MPLRPYRSLAGNGTRNKRSGQQFDHYYTNEMNTVVH